MLMQSSRVKSSILLLLRASINCSQVIDLNPLSENFDISLSVFHPKRDAIALITLVTSFGGTANALNSVKDGLSS